MTICDNQEINETTHPALFDDLAKASTVSGRYQTSEWAIDAVTACFGIQTTLGERVSLSQIHRVAINLGVFRNLSDETLVELADSLSAGEFIPERGSYLEIAETLRKHLVAQTQ